MTNSLTFNYCFKQLRHSGESALFPVRF